MWRTDRRDFVVGVATFLVVSCASVSAGLLTGVVLQWVSGYTRSFALRSEARVVEYELAAGGGAWERRRAGGAQGPPGSEAPPTQRAAVLTFGGTDLQFAQAQRVLAHVAEAQGALAPLRALVIDCSGLRAADYSGARALLAACEDVAEGVAARLAGDSPPVDSPPVDCSVFLAGLAEAEDAGGVGPLLRRCATALGMKVAPLAAPAAWTIGPITCCADVPAALEAAAAALSTPRAPKAPAPPALHDEGVPEAVLDLPLLAPPLSPEDPRAASAAQGLPTSELTREWTRQRRALQEAVGGSSDGEGAPGVTRTLQRLAERGPVAWWLVAPLRLLWAACVLASEMLGSSDPGAPLLRVSGGALP